MPDTFSSITFFWALIFSPVLITGIYLVMKADLISNKSKFFGTSVGFGYIAWFVGNLLGTLFLSFLQFVNCRNDCAIGDLVWAFPFLLPLISTHYIAKRSS